MFYSSNVKFVSNSKLALAYKPIQTPVKYTFNIEEHTQLNRYSVQNKYTQQLHAQFLTKADEGYKFDIKTSEQKFVLDKSLIQQGSMLEDLSALTAHLEVVVSGNGTIRWVNHNSIVRKWESLKKTLLQRYKSNQAHAYINGVEKRIHNEGLLLEDIRQVRLLGLFFGAYQLVQEKGGSRDCKISNLIYCLPLTFKEQIKAVFEDQDKSEKHIHITGSLLPIDDAVKERIKKYFSYYGAGKNTVYLSNYERKVVLDMQTGFPKNVFLHLQLTNGKEYVRKQFYQLTQLKNG